MKTAPVRAAPTAPDFSKDRSPTQEHDHPTETGGTQPVLPRTKHRRVIVNRKRQLELVEEELPKPGPGEVLAREVCRRCAPWGVESIPERVVWHMETEARVATYVDAYPLRATWDQALSLRPARLVLGEVDVEHGRHAAPPDRWKREWRRLARHDLIRANAWRAVWAARKTWLDGYAESPEARSAGGMASEPTAVSR